MLLWRYVWWRFLFTKSQARVRIFSFLFSLWAADIIPQGEGVNTEPQDDNRVLLSCKIWFRCLELSWEEGGWLLWILFVDELSKEFL